MWRLLQLFQRYQGARGGLASLPSWARFILLILALPGIAAIALSLLAFCASILALLLLTLPAYRLLGWLTGSRPRSEFMDATVSEDESSADPAAQAMRQAVRDAMGGVSVDVDEATEARETSAAGNRRQIEVKIIE